MTWEVLWALILGFALSALVQAVVSKREIGRIAEIDAIADPERVSRLVAAVLTED